MTPQAHASTGAACALESPGAEPNTSGAAYCGVPAFAPLSRSFAFFARPKSQIFTELTSFLAPRSKFSSCGGVPYEAMSGWRSNASVAELKGVEVRRDRTRATLGGEMRREKSLRIGVHIANAVVRGPV
jgi:hypothetical protein